MLRRQVIACRVLSGSFHSALRPVEILRTIKYLIAGIMSQHWKWILTIMIKPIPEFLCHWPRNYKNNFRLQYFRAVISKKAPPGKAIISSFNQREAVVIDQDCLQHPKTWIGAFYHTHRVYKQSYMDVIAESAGRVYERRNKISGMKMGYEPKYLRFFRNRINFFFLVKAASYWAFINEPTGFTAITSVAFPFSSSATKVK